MQNIILYTVDLRFPNILIFFQLFLKQLFQYCNSIKVLRLGVGKACQVPHQCLQNSPDLLNELHP